MNGRAQEFEFEKQTFSLKRAAFSEMHAVVVRINEGEVEGLLLEAAGEQAETLKGLLEAADHEQVIALWDDWLEFAGVAEYQKKYAEPRQAKVLQDQAEMFRAMKNQGLVSETFLQALLSSAMDELPN